MYRYLDRVNAPEDVKGKNIEELKGLAEDIRSFLINSLSETGGHLASNLGVVDLTLALHKVFDTRRDKIIWDVGHQVYTHKIITGRKDEFDTLRKFNGLSGFPKIEESEHDHFNTGHSSTSISAAVGMACARDLKNDNYGITAVIGDGALTGGMAFEALNHLGQLKSNVNVILNDNEMSIDKNVGGMSKYLNKARTAPLYSKVKSDMESIKNQLPEIGKNLFEKMGKAKGSVKYLFIPGVLFEELGFTYLGPIDGHNVEELIDTIRVANEIKSPVLIHIITKKGKGYSIAENTPQNYHGVGPFDIVTGKGKKSSSDLSFSQVAGESMYKLGMEDSKTCVITAAMRSGTGMDKFANEFPKRYFDVGIAEQHGVTFSAGLAINGFKPYFAVYSTFLQRGFDQMIHDVCIQNLPVTILLDRSGLVGADGETHHGIFDISYLSMIPNMTIFSPRDGTQLNAMIDFSKNYNQPLVIRYPKKGAGEVDWDYKYDDISDIKTEIIKDEGDDFLILSTGYFIDEMLKVIDTIKDTKNIKGKLADIKIIKPLDESTIINLASSVRKIYIIEDNAIIGGVGEMLKALLKEKNIEKEVYSLGLPDKFIEHGSLNELYSKYGLCSENLIKLIEENN